MPVVGVGNAVNDDVARGPAYFELDVDVAGDITGEQLAAITSAYLDSLQTQDYTGYASALDVRRDGNVFLVDEPLAPGASTGDTGNRDQILAQARSWVALRQQLPGSTVGLRATTRAAPSSGTIQLPDAADYTAVASAVGKLAAGFGDLVVGQWTVSAGKQHPAEIRTSKRLPNAQELELWTTLNTDQSVPHADIFTINGPLTGPLWVSEKVPADDLGAELRLARQHLPIVARLRAPIVYTASNQYRGHVGVKGEATAPLMITAGGCTTRKYRPSPAEQALIDRYENCRR